MNKSKSKSEFSKVRRLIAVLQKCNGKAAVGGENALISRGAIKVLIVVGLLLLTGALFTVCFLIEPLIAAFISVKSVTQSIMLLMLMINFILSIKNIVTVLYTADDLPVLLPMPFSAGQIVTAKLAVASMFPIGLSVILINSVCLGMGIRAGMGSAYVIGTVLSSVLIPITGIAIATLPVVIVFRVFGFIRNRDITMVLGGVFTLALLIAYTIVSNSFSSEDSTGAALAVVNSVASISAGFPNISFMTAFMLDGSLVGLLISMVVTAAVVGLAMLAVKLFYLSTALSMQNTSSAKKAMSKSALAGMKKSGSIKALTKYEAKNTRRNPAYMIYGFAMSFLWPLMIGIPMFFGSKALLESIVFPLDVRTAALGAMLLGVTASCLSSGFNILAATAFSREGNTFSVLCSLPVDFGDYYKSKRNYAMLICSLGSVGYVIVIGVVCLAAGIVTLASCWVFLYSAALSFLINLIIVNCLLLNNSKKPYFNWDSETEISRKLCWINVVAIIIGVVAFIAFMLLLTLLSPERLLEMAQSTDLLTTITIISLSAVFAIALVLAFFINRYSVKKGANNLTEL